MSALPEPIEEESLTCFKSSRYYPAKLGQVIRDEYKVQAKLGYGATSTTWLCAYKKYRMPLLFSNRRNN